MNTSLAASAAATAGGGSVPWVARSSITISTASAPAAAASSRSASPIAPRRRIDHHDHVLALLDRQALVDHGPYGRGEVAHRRRIICRACRRRPPPVLLGATLAGAPE